jgi:hypothetical protein
MLYMVTIGPKLIHDSLATPRYLAKVVSLFFSTWPKNYLLVAPKCTFKTADITFIRKCLVLVYFKTTASFEFQTLTRSNDDQKKILNPNLVQNDLSIWYGAKGSRDPRNTTDTSCFLDHRDSDPLPPLSTSPIHHHGMPMSTHTVQSAHLAAALGSLLRRVNLLAAAIRDGYSCSCPRKYWY